MFRAFVIGLATVSFLFSLGASMYRGVTNTIEYAVEVDAARKARLWAQYVTEALPEIDRLVSTGVPTSAQRDVIEAVEMVGEVYRFKLLDAAGGTVFDSRSAGLARPHGGGPERSTIARQVVATGDAADSAAAGGRPDSEGPHVEARLPIVGAFGHTVGAVEVFVDQTATSVLFHRAFTWLAGGIAVAFVFAFGMPAFAYFYKARQERRARARVDYLANFDPMTDLQNRASFGESLGLRSDEDDPAWQNAAVVYVDVDNFKIINDTYGHNAGDAYLKHLAVCLSRCAGDRDIVARLGGDEFIVVAFDSTAESATALVESVMMAASEPVQADGRTILGQISAGIHWERGCRLSADERMQKADMALYQAKLDGRNMYRFFSRELEESILAHRAVERAIRTGLREQCFELHFQPLLQQHGRRCAGFEALVRLRDENGDTISPTQMIPVAESMGAINEIGQWVLNEAISVAAHWPAEMFVSVNLSAKQFEDGRLVDHVRDTLDRHGVAPSRLELEVTESLLMENTESVGAQLKALRDLGVSVAMDDFGTGYSSLGYLWQFGFDKLKIDRSFIAGLDQADDRAHEILDTIIMLGHKLDMTVTAEGIETQTQADALSGLACDHFQGFLFGRPMPAADIASYLLEEFRADASEAAVEPLHAKSA